MAVLAGEGAVAIVNFGSRLTLGLLAIASVLWIVLFPHFIAKSSTKTCWLKNDLIGIKLGHISWIGRPPLLGHSCQSGSPLCMNEVHSRQKIRRDASDSNFLLPPYTVLYFNAY